MGHAHPTSRIARRHTHASSASSPNPLPARTCSLGCGHFGSRRVRTSQQATRGLASFPRRRGEPTPHAATRASLRGMDGRLAVGHTHSLLRAHRWCIARRHDMRRSRLTTVTTRLCSLCLLSGLRGCGLQSSVGGLGSFGIPVYEFPSGRRAERIHVWFYFNVLYVYMSSVPSRRLVSRHCVPRRIYWIYFNSRSVEAWGRRKKKWCLPPTPRGKRESEHSFSPIQTHFDGIYNASATIEHRTYFPPPVVELLHARWPGSRAATREGS